MERILILVDVDGVLRNFGAGVERFYRKDFPDDPPHWDMVDGWNLDAVFPALGNREAFENYIYVKRPFDIFGTAPQHGFAVDELNKLVALTNTLENVSIEFKIVTKQMGGAVPATMYWLGKLGCVVRTIHFVTSWEEKLSPAVVGTHDLRRVLIIEDDPKVIQSAVDCGATAIMIDRPWNIGVEFPERVKAVPSFQIAAQLIEAVIKCADVSAVHRPRELGAAPEEEASGD